MEKRYFVLLNGATYSIIRKRPGAHELFEVVIPDAGTVRTAYKAVILLNEADEKEEAKDA